MLNVSSGATLEISYIGYQTIEFAASDPKLARVALAEDSEMLDEISQKIAKGMPAILILISVGALVGTWMSAITILSLTGGVYEDGLAVLFYFGYSVITYLADPLAPTVAYTSWEEFGKKLDQPLFIRSTKDDVNITYKGQETIISENGYVTTMRDELPELEI